jgi:hypothetical protein
MDTAYARPPAWLWRTATFILALVSLVHGLAGCDSNKHSPGGPLPGQFSDLQIILPAELQPRTALNISITFAGGSGPFTVAYDFGGLAENVAPRALTGARSDTQRVTFGGTPGSATTGTLSVTVLDQGTGQSARATRLLAVEPLDLPPANAEFETSPGSDSVTLRLVANPEDEVAVMVECPPTLQVSPGTAVLRNGEAATFHFTGSDIFAGNLDVTTFRLTSLDGEVTLYSIPVDTRMGHVGMDTLLAIPLEESVAVGVPVTIVVATTVPSNPFRYLAGCRVCAPQASGFEYVANSFNVGAPGGETYASDGFWEALSPDGFLLPPGLILREDTGDGRWGLDFTVTPQGGVEATNGAGALLNFQATFSAPGTWPLTFQQFETVNRTYYRDANQAPDYIWSDSSNDYPGVPNRVTVQ